MNTKTIILVASFICFLTTSVGAYEQLGKATENHIMAQALVNEIAAKNPDLIMLSLHSENGKGKGFKVIASNLNRIGKPDDDTTTSIIHLQTTVLMPNLRGFKKYEIQMPLPDAAGKVVGWIDFLFRYENEADAVSLLNKAVKIRDRMAKKIENAQALFQPNQ